MIGGLISVGLSGCSGDCQVVWGTVRLFGARVCWAVVGPGIWLCGGLGQAATGRPMTWFQVVNRVVISRRYSGCREGSCYQPHTTAFSLVISGVSGSVATPIADRLHRSTCRLVTWDNAPDPRVMTATFTTPQFPRRHPFRGNHLAIQHNRSVSLQSSLSEHPKQSANNARTDAIGRCQDSVVRGGGKSVRSRTVTILPAHRDIIRFDG